MHKFIFGPTTKKLYNNEKPPINSYNKNLYGGVTIKKQKKRTRKKKELKAKQEENELEETEVSSKILIEEEKLNKMNSNRIEIILGCMFSGKSTELLRRLNRYESINISTLLINSSYDERTDNSIQTHDKVKKNAYKLFKLMDIIENDDYIKSNVIGIDEAQFFTDLREFVIYSEKLEKTIIIAGLDGDSNREPFGEILKCIPLCDEVIKLTALDMIDKDSSKAIFSKRIDNNISGNTKDNNISGNTIDIGSEDKYLAVSRKNYFK